MNGRVTANYRNIMTPVVGTVQFQAQDIQSGTTAPALRSVPLVDGVITDGLRRGRGSQQCLQPGNAAGHQKFHPRAQSARAGRGCRRRCHQRDRACPVPGRSDPRSDDRFHTARFNQSSPTTYRPQPF